MGECTGLTLHEAAAAIRAGELDSRTLTASLIARIERESGLNAFIHVAAEAALEAASAADASAPAGPLHGVPIAVKDCVDVAGMPCSVGTALLRDFVPAADAAVVARLRAAGAIVIGKTNLHELCFGITSNNAAFGPVRNPYDPLRSAGGSSGGSGAAVAARLVPAAWGTDTGGSIRIPASFCGVTGLRPTLGRYPGQGIAPLARTSRDTSGPIARCVADLALLDACAADAGATRLEPAALRGLRLGVCRDPYHRDLDPATAFATERTLATLAGLGVELVELDLPELAAQSGEVGFTVALHEFRRDFPAHLAQAGCALDFRDFVATVASPDVRALLTRFLLESEMSAAAYRQAIDVARPRLQRTFAEAFGAHRIEALVHPTTPLPPPLLGLDDELCLNGVCAPTFSTVIRNTDPGSNAGLPGVSLPMGQTPGGLPLGLALDGPAGSDRRLLAIALALEAALGRPPPPL